MSSYIQRGTNLYYNYWDDYYPIWYRVWYCPEYDNNVPVEVNVIWHKPIEVRVTVERAGATDDSELCAIDKIVTELESLDEDARRRTLEYINDRFAGGTHER